MYQLIDLDKSNPQSPEDYAATMEQAIAQPEPPKPELSDADAILAIRIANDWKQLTLEGKIKVANLFKPYAS